LRGGLRAGRRSRCEFKDEAAAALLGAMAGDADGARQIKDEPGR
jgi:hypothetical protein